MNTQPTPGRFLTESEPPLASIALRLIVSPNPTPVRSAPDCRKGWNICSPTPGGKPPHSSCTSIWIGAAFTAGLFALGKYGMGAYLGSSGVASSFGAAGSVVALLLWVYYSAQIFFLGAEFTKQYALEFGSLRRASG
ncbi:MAG TPA: YhjD/YihY/BrkB family envelope integrity protein [Usitatibacter sp.]